VSPVNVDSHTEVLEPMADYPLFGMVVWDVKPVLTFREGTDAVRAKLVEAQAAMGGRQAVILASFGHHGKTAVQGSSYRISALLPVHGRHMFDLARARCLLAEHDGPGDHPCRGRLPRRRGQDPRGESRLKGVDGAWRLFEAQ
jgi:hypothetical protein